MPDPTYKFHPVYDDKGKRIKVDPPADLPETSGKKLRMGYPFHILKEPGHFFIVKTVELAASLRSQASKRNAETAVHGKKLTVTFDERKGYIVTLINTNQERGSR